MAFGNFLDNAKNKVSQVTNGKSDQLIADNLARIQQLFRTRAGGMAKSIMQDDSKMTDISRFVYGELPLPVRLVLKEEAFVDFCLKNRDKVLGESA